MNASQSIIEAEAPNLALEDRPSEIRPVRLLEAPVKEDVTESDSFKKTASLFGSALSSLFR